MCLSFLFRANDSFTGSCNDSAERTHTLLPAPPGADSSVTKAQHQDQDINIGTVETCNFKIPNSHMKKKQEMDLILSFLYLAISEVLSF